MKPFVIWVLVVAASLAVGFTTGAALDASLWYLSRDYIYLPYEFRSSGSVIGLLAGTCAAAAAVVGRRQPPTVRQIFAALALGCAVLVAFTLGGGLVGGAIGKAYRGSGAESHLAPIARVFTCEGLWQGARSGAVVGTIVMCRLTWRFRVRRAVLAA